MIPKRFDNPTHSIIAMLLAVFLLAGLAGCGLPPNQQKTPTPAVTAVPTETSVYQPDLIILDVSLENNKASGDRCATPASSWRLQVVVANQGNAATDAFDVQVDKIQRRVPDGLAAGQKMALWFAIDNLSPQIEVDIANQVQEVDETNNRLAMQLDLPTLPAECLQTPTPVLTYQTPLATLEGHAGPVASVTFSPDGSLLASGSVDDTLRLWIVEQARLLRTMQGHSFPVRKVVFTPNGADLVTGSTDGRVRVWQVSNGLLTRTMSGHAGWITGLSISEDGRLLVSSAEDFTVRIWRLPGGTPVQTIDEGMSAVSDVTFSPQGNSIAWAEADGTVRLRALSGEWLHIFKDTQVAAISVAFSPSGGLLAASYADGMIRVWRVSDGSPVQTLKGHSQAINALAFSPDGRWLVSGSSDGTLRLWQFAEAEFLHLPVVIYTGHSEAVNSVDFSPQGTLIVSGSDDGTVRLWEAPRATNP